MDWTWGWTAVAAIATCILAGSIFVAIWQIIVTRQNTKKQLEATRRSTNAQLAVELFRELRGIDTIRGLRAIYSLTPDKLKNLSKEALDQIESVLERLDMLGGLVAKGIIDEELAMEIFAGPPALRCWYQLATDFVKVRQEERGCYCENYEDLTRRALDYFRNANREIWFYREGEKDKPINLVTELQKDELHPRSLKEIEQETKSQGKGKA